jgi:hypothetical protein
LLFLIQHFVASIQQMQQLMNAYESEISMQVSSSTFGSLVLD